MDTTSANLPESTSPQSLHKIGPSTSGQAAQAQGESRDQELSKKRKRDKYVEKACGPCKIRKIKCGGGFPCASCVRRDRACSDSGDGNEHDNSALTSNGGDVRLGPNSLYQLPPLSDSRNLDSTAGLHERLSALESNLTNLTRILLQIAPLAGSNASISGQTADARQSHSPNSGENAAGSVADVQNTQDTAGVSPKDYLSFASGKNLASERNLGETSATHALQRVEDRLNELGVQVVERESAPRTPPMTPVPWDSRQLNNKSTLDRVLRALNSNGIVPSRTHWDEYLEIFLIEVHSLYPFSHEPAISETYERLWESLKPGNEELASNLNLDKVCHLLLMLALGRCTVSCRVHKGEGLHSAGWSLYCTAMELQGSLLDIVNDDSKPLDSLHTLALVVIYLIRVDANERAQKFLALAVIHAQHLGIHLKQTHEDMPDFDSEMFRRVWWCIYVLDRRVSLVLGRPFIIQDNNVTVELSKDLAATTPGSSHGSVLDFYHIESGTSNLSSIHYLNVMVGYSKLVGKVWETLFGADTNTRAKPHVHEYLDALVHNWMDSVPNILVCDHENIHQATLPTSPKLFHQRFLIRLRYLYTLIQIRNPIRRLRNTPVCGNDIESEIICLQQARSIVGMFAQCSLADSVYGFPFLPYLLDTTIIILACLTKLPMLKPNYHETAEKAVKMLTQFCKKSWVSGKMARMIFKLEDIIPRIFASSQSHPHLSSYRGGDHTSMNTPQPNQTEGFPDPHTTLPLPPHHNNSSSSLSPRPMNQAWSMNNIHPGTQLHEDDLTSSNFQSSMIVDFPFELNFGNTTSHAIAPLNQAGRTHGNGMRQDVSTPFLGTSDLDWLDDLILQDDRSLPLS